MPVYNAQSTIDSALTAIRRQSHPHLQVIVSDNASTDGTVAACRAHVAADPRVLLIEQPRNVGAPANFCDVLRRATGPYFMWAAADDTWAPSFIERNLMALEAEPRLVASVSRVRFMDDTGREDDLGTRPFTGDVATNVASFLSRPGPNSRFYGLFRREVLVACLIEQGCLAWDWAIMARTLTYGWHGRVDEVLLFRGVRGESQQLLPVIERYNQGVGRLVPLLAFTRHVLAEPRVPRTAGVLLALAKQNAAYLYAATRARLR